MYARCFLILFLFATAHILSAQNESTTYLQVGSDGAGNILFASEKIAVGGEPYVTLKNRFVSGEPIWGRAYFPQRYDQYNTSNNDLFYLEIQMDGHSLQTVYQEHPEQDWGQMQVWISGTENNYFSGFQDAINQAEPGEYNVTVILGIKRYVRENSIDTSPSDKKKARQKIYDTIVLSKGTFHLIKI